MKRTAALLGLLALFGLALAEARADSAKAKESELLARADEVTKKVARLRGLAQKRPITRGVMNKKQITERLKQRIDQEYSPEEIRGEELSLKRLGLLAHDADYLGLVLGLLTDQIAGFYDPWARELYLADWTTFGGDMLMAHEIDHALQDQHFDLRKLMKPDKTNADSTVARQALVEGDGMALMLEFSLDGLDQVAPWGREGFVETVGEQMTASMGSLKKSPLVLREGLIFPYRSGLVFVAHFLKRHPWTKVDSIYAKPPLSTEQVLHPEKYISFERPIEVAERPAATLAGYKKAYDNVSGEIGLQVFLRQHKIADEKAEIAAAGWGGDRLVVYTPPGFKKGVSGSLGVHYTVFDSDADALEYFESLSDAMLSLTGGRRVASRDGYVEHRTRTGEVATAERKGDAVLLIIGAPPARAEELGEQVWKGWSVKRPK